MKRLYKFAVIAAMMLTLAVAAGAAMAQDEPETGAQNAGHIYLDYGSGIVRTTPPPTGPFIVGDVYDNTLAPAQAGFSTADINGIYGDELILTGGGTLDQQDFSVYNSSTSAGSLVSASWTISYFTGPSGSPGLGGFNTGVVTFSTPLAKGFYTFITVTGLGGLAIVLPTDIIVTQKFLTHTGAANRAGVVSLDPPTVGSSANTFYQSSTTAAAGWYTSGTLNVNLGYRVNVTNSTPTKKTTWGSLKNLYR